MSTEQAATARHAAEGRDLGDASTGELVARLSQDVTRLVRDELHVARLEMSGKAKQAGIGAGMFGAAGLLALYGVGALVAAGVLALTLALPGWLAALVVALVLLAGAGLAALLGRKRVSAGVPPLPERAVDGIKRDVAAVRHPHDH